jgi:pyrimidine operon attenuation protein / uracil phosphoribosyltransferase
MAVLLTAEEIKGVIERCAKQIADDLGRDQAAAVIGIRSRGVVFGERLSEAIAGRLSCELPTGALDITLHRDDINEPRGEDQLVVRSTEIDFDIDKKIVILADDVLHTGRSIRAAMDALMEFGRPCAIRLAVLVDRGGRELPISADYTGQRVEVDSDKKVRVKFVEPDGVDEVVVE